MPRLPILAALALLTALALAPAAQAKGARAVLVSCDRTGHAAAFDGRMDARAGAPTMQMRFRLQVSQPGDAAWRSVTVPGFGAWTTSGAGRPGYVFTRRVEHLLAPASYRVQVRFRWRDAAGAVVATAAAVSKPCRQPDSRPDLAVTRIEIRPAAAAGQRRYAVTVRNSGRSAAPASSVSLELGGGPPLVTSLGALAPGASAVVGFGAPACEAGTAVVATADAADTVDEHDEDDDVLTLTCP
jgi:hypothetical protein